MTAGSPAAISRDALSDRVHAILRARIMELDLEPGSRVNIDELSRELQVSRTPIREALNRLASERLVLAEPYRGFRVAPLLDREALRDLFEARAVIETGAVAGAVENLSQDDHARLRALVEELDAICAIEAFDVDAFNLADARLHRITVAASGNVFLTQAWEDLRVHAQIGRHYQGRSVGEAARANAEHHELLTALVARDADAVRVHVIEHIHGVFSRLEEETE